MKKFLYSFFTIVLFIFVIGCEHNPNSYKSFVDINVYSANITQELYFLVDENNIDFFKNYSLPPSNQYDDIYQWYIDSYNTLKDNNLTEEQILDILNQSILTVKTHYEL